MTDEEILKRASTMITKVAIRRGPESRLYRDVLKAVDVKDGYREGIGFTGQVTGKLVAVADESGAWVAPVERLV